MTAPEQPPPGALKVWLLAPDGSPTGENWWDRTLRLDGRYETLPGSHATRVVLSLLGGTDRTWQRLHDHLRDPRPSWPPAAMHPLAFEAWTYLGPTTGWMHVLMARADVDDIGGRPPEGGRPVWRWVARPNPKWPGEEKAWTSAMVWRRGEITPPADAPVYELVPT